MNITIELEKLFERRYHQKANTIIPILGSGSNRKYFRIANSFNSAIGVFNNNKKENKAFIYLSKHFAKNKLNVPKIYSTKLKQGLYLIEDLGDTTLFSFLMSKRKGNFFPSELISYYKRAIEELPKFQINARTNLDFSICYPRSAFDKQSILWDLNYFKYYFIKPFNIPFDEQNLENDFNTLTKFLLSADSNYFMYRDFNSRNIMIKDEDLYFIDYQGGRKGALQYDIVSLLFDSKANIPFNLREEFLEHYLLTVNKLKKINTRDFLKYYDGYILIRLLQMFGAYGFRGIIEGKSHFLQSIPFALNNLKWLLNRIKNKNKMPELFSVLEKLVVSKELKQFSWNEPSNNKLTVRINSFSFKDKIPLDLSGNGGGFVFDCRAIPNPGKIEEYKHLTGKDKPVQDYLNTLPQAQKFLNNSFDIVSQSIENYIGRGWTDLMINFGCTGGQHRSVYFAEKLAQLLASRYDINIKISHTQLQKSQLN